MAFQRQQLSRRVVHDLQKRSTSGVFFYMLVPPVLLFTDGYIHQHLTVSLVFLGIFTSICLFRLAHVQVFKKVPEKYEAWHKSIFIVSILSTALAWGVGAAFFLLYFEERTIQLLMLICTVGFCAGGVLSFMPVLYLSVAYNFLMLVPAIAAVFINGEVPSLGIAMILYSIYLVLIHAAPGILTALENDRFWKKKAGSLKSQPDDVLTTYNAGIR